MYGAWDTFSDVVTSALQPRPKADGCKAMLESFVLEIFPVLNLDANVNGWYAFEQLVVARHP